MGLFFEENPLVKVLSGKDRQQFLRLRSALVAAEKSVVHMPNRAMMELGIPAKERDQAQAVLILTHNFLSPAARANYQPSDRVDANCGHLLIGLGAGYMRQIADLLKPMEWYTLHRIGSVDPVRVEMLFLKHQTYYPLALRTFQKEYYDLLGTELQGLRRAAGKPD